jgi:hypothetical protein
VATPLSFNPQALNVVIWLMKKDFETGRVRGCRDDNIPQDLARKLQRFNGSAGYPRR